MKLIPEQTEVVDHNLGPALVFAVAGAGKTTAMVARAERLVREGVFNARNIFAGSFSKASVNAIEGKLKALPHCAAIELGTTHRLAGKILSVASREGLVPELNLNPLKEFGVAATVVKRLKSNVPAETLLEQVHLWKANLVFADLEAQIGSLPSMGASQLQGEMLELYQSFELVRLERNLMGFGDLVSGAWVLLRRYPEVLERVQNRYQCLFVDEYQDVNLAQASLVELIASRDRNIMVLGDDDQCIFGFQGASSKHILGFEQRWQAKKFILADNFRCQASHLGLANRVISHNSNREAKQASLTLGFGGETKLHQVASQADMVEQIVDRIAIESLKSGLANVAVLVRNFNNNLMLESQLLKRGIPYQLEGRDALRERPEAKAVIASFYLNRFFGLARAKWTADDVHSFGEHWNALLSGLNSGLKRALRGVEYSVLKQNLGFNQSLSVLEETGDVIFALLEFTCGLKELPLEQAFRQTISQPIWSWVERADPRKTGALEHLCQSFHPRETLENLFRVNIATEAVTISSIHSSKGLEWDVVIMPDVEDGVLPHGSFPSELNLADERRLFYVGVTRCRQKLHLFTRQGQRSRFFDEALIEKLLSSMAVVGEALHVHPRSWTTNETLEVARSVDELGMERFFERYFEAQKLLDEAGVKIMQLINEAGKYNMRDRLEISAMAQNYWQQRALN